MGKYSITVENFSKSFGPLKAVDDLSFDVQDGEIFAFLGTNGSGKTTTIRCLLKIYKEDSGILLINNQEYNDSINDKIGYLPEERGLYKDVTVLDILTYTARLRGINSDIAKEKSIKYLKKVDLMDHKDKLISQLSSGMQQKVQLGTALIHDPEILILDEPFKGLDPVNRQMFVDILLDKAKKGATILYSTHVIDEAQKMANKILFIKNGKRIEYGNTHEVRKKHGTKSMFIEFAGKAPRKNIKMYDIDIKNNTAEIIPKVDNDIVIQELIRNGTKIIKLELDYPSLNQIFIELMKKDE